MSMLNFSCESYLVMYSNIWLFLDITDSSNNVLMLFYSASFIVFSVAYLTCNSHIPLAHFFKLVPVVTHSTVVIADSVFSHCQIN